MDIEILDVMIDEPNDQSSKVGNVYVSVSGKMNLWFTILKSKEGKGFCVPASINLNHVWRKAFTLTNETKLRALSHAIMAKLREEGKIQC